MSLLLLVFVASIAVGGVLVSGETIEKILYVNSAEAERGTLSADQGLDVIKVEDQTGTENDWSKYLVANPRREASGFIVDFKFRYDADPNDEGVEKIEVVVNTMGYAEKRQRRYFQIRDFSAENWVYLGDNAEAPSQVWYRQIFVLEGTTLTQYFSDSLNRNSAEPNVVWIRFRSENRKGVCNIDFLACNITVAQGGGGGGGGSSSPTARTTAAPTAIPSALPSWLPSGFPSPFPSNRPSSDPTGGPTQSSSDNPSSDPSSLSSPFPSSDPSQMPTGSPVDPSAPTDPPAPPTDDPTALPSAHPSDAPTIRPSDDPTSLPTAYPSSSPSDIPTANPVQPPSGGPAPPSTATRTLPILDGYAQIGQLSDQGLHVLSTQDVSGTDDVWANYLEAKPSKGKTGSFEIVFDFRYDRSSYPQDEDLLMIEVHANTIGQTKQFQLRRFELYDFESGSFLTIGDNEGAPSWVWHSQSMYVDAAMNPSRFVSSEGIVRIVFSSDNKVDVSNIDYLVIQLIFSTNGGGGGPPSPSPPPVQGPTPNNTVGDWWKPKASDRLTWQWQLQGNIDDSYDVDMYDIDLFDNTAEVIASLQSQGRIVVCYFSAGTYEGWRPDWPEYFDFITGTSYSGDEPPFAGRMRYWNERWLDIRRIDLLGPIMRGRLRLAKEKGCNAVEPDNVDAWSNSQETKLDLTPQDQINYLTWLSGEAHAIGMSVGLKNNVEQVPDLHTYFDWALNEQCFQYNECGNYVTYFISNDKAVFGVEYENANQCSNTCDMANSMGLSWLIKDIDLYAEPRLGCEDCPESEAASV